VSSGYPLPVDRLISAMVVRAIAPADLAKRAGISTRTLRRAMNGRALTLETRLRISQALAALPVDKKVAAVELELAS
jgi:transcriptional regulator with XRE-family HTH domain